MLTFSITTVGTNLTRQHFKTSSTKINKLKQSSLRYDPNSYTVTANILPHTAGISRKTLISLPPFIALPPLCRQPTFLLSLSAKVAAMFGLLEANLDFAASTWRGMQQHWLLWFQPQPEGLMSLLRFCLLFLVVPNSLFVVWVWWEMRRQTATHTNTHRYFDFSEEMTEEKQDKNTATDKTQTH